MRTLNILLSILLVLPLLGANFEFSKENYAGRSGIVLGGLGTGTIEIRPNGALEEWQIFNNTANPYPSPRSFFAIRVKQEGKDPIAKVLQLNHETLPTIEKISYKGEFPFAHLRYIDKDLPIQVELTAFSSFIPHDYKNSALPLAFFRFKLKNTAPKKCDASLLFSSQNMVGIGEGYSGKVSNRLISQKGFYGVDLSVPVGEPAYYSRPIRVLIISRPDVPDFRAQLARTIEARNLEIRWMRVDGGKVLLPTKDPSQLKRDYDLLWLAETTRMAESLGEENMRAIREAVRMGMPFILTGGWDSFYGFNEERCGRLAGTIIEEIVPIKFKTTFIITDILTPTALNFCPSATVINNP